MALFDDILAAPPQRDGGGRPRRVGRTPGGPPQAPQTLINALAADTIKVAAPVLTRSPALSEDVLLKVANTRDQDHLRAISRRFRVPEAVSDAIVARGDDNTLGVLLRNENAALSRAAQEAAVDRAQVNPDLHEAVVDRHTLPPDLLNEMYFVVEARLRDRILEKNVEIDPSELDAALEAGRKRVAARDGAFPPDYTAAEAAVRSPGRRKAASASATLASFSAQRRASPAPGRALGAG